MKKLFLSLALGLLFAFGVNAQNAKGDWYVGSGDIANVAWTDWSVSPLIGYAFTDALVGGVNISQAVEKIKSDFKQTDEIKTILNFIDKSDRGLI